MITEQQHANNNDTQVCILTIGNDTIAVKRVISSGQKQQQQHDGGGG